MDDMHVETELENSIYADERKIVLPIWSIAVVILVSSFFTFQIWTAYKNVDEINNEEYESLKLSESIVEKSERLDFVLKSTKQQSQNQLFKKTIRNLFDVKGDLFYISALVRSSQVDTLTYNWKIVLSKLEFYLKHDRKIDKDFFVNPSIESLIHHSNQLKIDVVQEKNQKINKAKKRLFLIVTITLPLLILFVVGFIFWNRRARHFVSSLDELARTLKSSESIQSKKEIESNTFEIPQLINKNFRLIQSKYQRQIERMDLKIDENAKAVLDEKRNISEILDYVKQAIFRIDESFSMVSPISIHCHTVFGENIEGKSVFDVLFQDGFGFEDVNREAKSALIGVFGESELQWDLMEHHLPTRYKRFNSLAVKGKEWQILRLNYSPLYNSKDELKSIMVVVEDVSEIERLEAEKTESEEKIKTLQSMSSFEPDEIELYFQNTVILLSEILSYLRGRQKKSESVNVLLRKIHTLKGNSRSMKFESLGRLFHELEDLFFKYNSDDDVDNQRWIGQLHLYDSLMEIFHEIKVKHELAQDYFQVKNELFNVLYWEIFHLFILLDTTYIPHFFETKRILLTDKDQNKGFMETIQLLAILTQRTDEAILSEALMSLFRLIEEKKSSIDFDNVFEHLYLQSKSKIMDWLMAENNHISQYAIRNMGVEIADWNLSNQGSNSIKSLKIPLNTPFYILWWIWNVSAHDLESKARFTNIYLHLHMQLGMIGIQRKELDDQSLIPSQIKKVDDNMLIHSTNLFFNALDRMDENKADKSSWMTQVNTVMVNGAPSLMDFVKDESVDVGIKWLEKVGFDIDPSLIRVPNGGGYWRNWLEVIYQELKEIPSSILILDFNLQMKQLNHVNSKPYEFNDDQMVSKQALTKLKYLVQKNYHQDGELKDSLDELYHESVSVAVKPLRKMVKGLSFQLEKNVDFKIVGDGGLLSQMEMSRVLDSLGHLIRNAMDHGIETSQERIKAGKEVTGNLLLQLYQGKEFFIAALMDDGRGIDPEKIYSKAIAIGAIDPLTTMSTDEKVALVFKDELSTAGEVSMNSGRGIGLSAVKDIVDKMGGTIEINSEIKKGTEFVIRLPVKNTY
jgi:signal transduction histidine kinase